jgi:hypothetical protein
MFYGVIKTILSGDHDVLTEACPGHVVDVIFKKKSRHVDAPLEYPFHVVQGREVAMAILAQR